MRRATLALLVLAAIAPVQAQAKDSEREYCPARPGLGTPACTIAPGRVSVETALADWTREDDPDRRTDTVLIGDTLVRVGLGDAIEAQVGWTPYGHVRTRDVMTGGVETAGRVGDAYLGVKANLHDPDGSGLSVAVQPFVTLPVGRAPLGAGDWGAGVLVPVTYDLSDAINVQFTPELDAMANAGAQGRHLAYSGVAGLGVAINDALTGEIEFQALRDDDPAGATTQALAGVSLAWMAGKATQFDIGANAGLNRSSPDMEIYLGVSRRF